MFVCVATCTLLHAKIKEAKAHRSIFYSCVSPSLSAQRDPSLSRALNHYSPSQLCDPVCVSISYWTLLILCFVFTIILRQKQPYVLMHGVWKHVCVCVWKISQLDHCISNTFFNFNKALKVKHSRAPGYLTDRRDAISKERQVENSVFKACLLTSIWTNVTCCNNISGGGAFQHQRPYLGHGTMQVSWFVSDQRRHQFTLQWTYHLNSKYTCAPMGVLVLKWGIRCLVGTLPSWGRDRPRKTWSKSGGRSNGEAQHCTQSIWPFGRRGVERWMCCTHTLGLIYEIRAHCVIYAKLQTHLPFKYKERWYL